MLITAPVERRLLRIVGLVQGVGFRPYLYRLATELSLGGWVRNDSGGVELCLDGPAASIELMLGQLTTKAPGLARIDAVEVIDQLQLSTWSAQFIIAESLANSGSGALVTPDSYVCDDCLSELFDPTDRRHRYPFINCTNCGPRFSILRALPYDRPNTTMAEFDMCERCLAEYHDPADRRFHAQPIACWDCGPRAQLVTSAGTPIPTADPVAEAVNRLRQGHILAVKALGGYQLVVDPIQHAAVARLRAHKERSRKPFALLARNESAVARYARLNEAESRLLQSPGRPIVLLRAHAGNELSADIAPRSETLGFMLPCTPLQYLLLQDGVDVLVATSGNAKDMPMAITKDEAVRTLGPIVDSILVHDRTIEVRVDDSVARIVSTGQGARPTFIRRGRGYSPDSFPTPVPIRSTLALGAELKDTVCLGKDRTLYLGPHIGDLKSAPNRAFLGQLIAHLTTLFGITPEVVAHDMHPNFHTTALAATLVDLDRAAVQHHHAHLASCMLDNGLDRPVLGVIFDGTGYGPDATIWGGEFLSGDFTGFNRLGHLRTFRLPGGDAAVRNPARIAVGMLCTELELPLGQLPQVLRNSFDNFQLELLRRMTQQGINSPVTSSMGRLFDVVSSLLDVCHKVDYEGQAAIELEQLIEWDTSPAEPWPISIYREGAQLVLDHRPWLEQLLGALRSSEPRALTARRFHETVVHSIVQMCQRLSAATGLTDVVLSGGVFLNQHLAVRAQQELLAAGLQPHTHHRVPPTDGGISVGQAMIAGLRNR